RHPVVLRAEHRVRRRERRDPRIHSVVLQQLLAFRRGAHLAFLEIRSRLVDATGFGVDVEEALIAGQRAEDAGDLVGAAAAFASLASHEDPRVVATAKLNLGRVAWRRNDLDAALVLCEESRAIAMRVGDQDLRARTENAIGVLRVAREEFAQAKAAYVVALELTED